MGTAVIVSDLSSLLTLPSPLPLPLMHLDAQALRA